MSRGRPPSTGIDATLPIARARGRVLEIVQNGDTAAMFIIVADGKVFFIYIRRADPFRDIRLNVRLSGIDVFADPFLEKVFYNLFDDALRYGGELMTVIHAYYRTNDSALTLVVEDDGVGIPAGEKSRIFEREFGKNTGLGLFLTKEILAITGITIRETGIPGNGAHFEITVPKGTWHTNPAPSE